MFPKNLKDAVKKATAKSEAGKSPEEKNKAKKFNFLKKKVGKAGKEKEEKGEDPKEEAKESAAEEAAEEDGEGGKGKY